MSDIHGNLPALRAVVDSLPEHDAVYVAGDHCLEGPCPAAVLDLLDDLGWTLVMGNTDRDIVSPPAEAKQVKRERIEWTRGQLGERRLELLASLPFSTRLEAGGDRVLAVHANPLTMDEHLRPSMSDEELAPYLRDAHADLLVFGHLHIPYTRPVGDMLLMDVSSVGHPKDRDRRSAYVAVTWDGDSRRIDQVRVPYDIEETIGLLRRSGMPGAESQIEDLLKASY
jgi:putative phosphoesterase